MFAPFCSLYMTQCAFLFSAGSSGWLQHESHEGYWVYIARNGGHCYQRWRPEYFAAIASHWIGVSQRYSTSDFYEVAKSVPLWMLAVRKTGLWCETDQETLSGIARWQQVSKEAERCCVPMFVVPERTVLQRHHTWIPCSESAWLQQPGGVQGRIRNWRAPSGHQKPFRRDRCQYPISRVVERETKERGHEWKGELPWTVSWQWCYLPVQLSMNTWYFRRNVVAHTRPSKSCHRMNRSRLLTAANGQRGSERGLLLK